jgi:hypothetical protein
MFSFLRQSNDAKMLAACRRQLAEAQNELAMLRPEMAHLKELRGVYRDTCKELDETRKALHEIQSGAAAQP